MHLVNNPKKFGFYLQTIQGKAWKMRENAQGVDLLYEGRALALEVIQVEDQANGEEEVTEEKKEDRKKLSSIVGHYLGKAAILYALCLMVGIAVGAAYYSQAPEWFYDKEDAVTMVFVSGFGGFWLFWMVMDVANDVTMKFIKSKKWRYTLLFLVGYFIVYPSICKILFEEFVS